MKKLLFLMIIMSISAQEVVAANDSYVVIDVPSSQSVDVYFSINVSGHVYLKIENSNGSGCAELWWIK